MCKPKNKRGIFWVLYYLRIHTLPCMHLGGGLGGIGLSRRFHRAYIGNTKSRSRRMGGGGVGRLDETAMPILQKYRVSSSEFVCMWHVHTYIRTEYIHT